MNQIKIYYSHGAVEEYEFSLEFILRVMTLYKVDKIEIYNKNDGCLKGII